MPRGILPEVQWIVIRLSSLLVKDHISIYTGLSVRSIERILEHFNAHRTIIITRSQEKKQWKKHLRNVDVEVSSIPLWYFLCSNKQTKQFLLGTVQQTPDLYLDELCEILATNCGVKVSRATVWRTLRASAFTMKKVCI
jgi:transposase